MPELETEPAELPAILRQRMTPEECNVLLMGRGVQGISRIRRQWPVKLRTVEDATKRLQEVRVKAAKIIAKHQDEERAARIEAPDGLNGVIADITGADPETLAAGNGKMQSEGSAGADPPTGPAEPSSSSSTNGRATPSRRRAQGEARTEALDILREYGPMRQADIAQRMDLRSPSMSLLVSQLRAGGEVVEIGREDRSPVLALPDQVEDSNAVAEDPEDDAIGPVGDGEEFKSPAEAAVLASLPHAEAEPDSGGNLTEPVEPEPEPEPETELVTVPAGNGAGEVWSVAVAVREGMRWRYADVLLRRLEAQGFEPELAERFERLSGL